MEYSLAPLAAHELAKVERNTDRPVVGLHRALADEAMASGRWEALDGGRWIWRCSILSPGAAGVRLHFTGFAVGAGRVWVHDGSGELGEIMGPYSGRGPFEDGEFWSDSVMSDRIVVEFEPQAPPSTLQSPPFRIVELSHLFSDALPVTAPAAGVPSLEYVSPLAGLAGGPAPSAAASCHLDVSCYADWADTSKAVGLIVYEDGGSSYVCSGTLLNTRANSGVPYFLTADHCVNNDTVARTVQSFWFYQTQTCGGTPPNLRDAPRTSGSRYIAGAGMVQGDFTLLRLNSVPSGVMFSGWDSSEIAIGTNVTGVHHPAGDYTRISFGSRVAGRPGFGADPNNFYSVQWSGGIVQGGSSGSGIFSSPNVLVGTLSHGPKVDDPETLCSFNPLVTNYGRFATAYPALRDFLEDRTTTTPPPPPSSGTPITLASGTPRSFSLDAVSSPTLFKGSAGYQITVPQGATRLEVRLATTTPNADLDLFVRYGSEPAVSGGTVAADYNSSTPGGNESVVITADSNPPLKAGTYYISIALFTTGVAVAGNLTATVTTSTAPPPPSGGPIALTSGVARNFSLGPVANPTLFLGGNSYTISVPQGATRLEIRVDTATATARIDLFARFGQDPEIANGQVVADYRSEGAGGDKTITVTSGSTPPLRAGTYYISLGLFTTGVTATGSVTATVTAGSAPPPPSSGGPTALTSGVAQNFSIGPAANPTLFRGANSYTVNVPQGATRLEIRVLTTTPNVDIDLFARFGQDPEIANGQVVADYRSEGSGGNETITITSGSSPALRAGTYYISLALFTTGVTAVGNITATVTTGSAPPPPPPPSGGPTALTSGAAQNFSIGPVANGTLFRGANSYTINVPQGATRLEIRLVTTTPNVDIDLFARLGQDPEVANQQVVADHRSEGPTGNETITVTSASSPALQAGTYYISLALFTTGVTASGNITATVTTGSAPPPPSSGPIALTSGASRSFSIGPVANPTLFHGSSSYTIEVPQGATRLEIQLSTATPGADVDLFARYGADTAISAGDVVADHRSTGPAGNEGIVVTPTSSPALRPGTYYISLAVFTTNTTVTGTLTATVTSAAAPPPAPSAPIVLTSGTAQNFTLPAVNDPTLFFGNSSFVIDVPEGAARLDIQLMTTTPGTDVDLFARFGADNTVADGNVVCDHSSTGPTGSERITITPTTSPQLRAGRYYISLGVFTTGITISGTVTAVVTTGATPPPASSGGTTLISGQTVNFSLPAVTSPTLFTGDYSYRVTVPEGATKLQVQVTSTAPSVDVDLYVRYGQDVDLGDGVIADWGSEGETGNETVVITPSSNPTLRPGTYYISLALYSTGTPSTGTVTATIERGSLPPPVSAARPLASGAATPYSLPAVAQPTFFSGEYGYRVVVPANAGKLEVTLRTEPSTVDVDLFVRYGAEPELVNGRIVADYRSTTDTGNEFITVQSLTVPPLRPGVYFIAFAVYSTGTPASGTITATISGTASASADEAAIDKGVGETGAALAPKPPAPVAIPLPNPSKEEYAEPDALRKELDRIRKPKSVLERRYE